MQENILKFFQSISTPFLDFLFQAITFLGEQYVTIAIVSWLYWNYSKKEGFLLTFIYMISVFVNLFAKILVHTQRPFQVLDNIEGKRLTTATGYSFPSGHTQGASTLYFGLALIFKKRWLYITAIVLSVLVALSRIYLGVHWPVDVFFGMLFGFVIPYIFYSFLRKHYDNKTIFNELLIKITVAVYILAYFLAVYNYFFYRNELEVSDLLKVLGVFTGTVVGFILQEKKLTFIVEQKMYLKIIRYLIGVLIAVGLLVGLKFLFPEMGIFNYFRYLIVGAWVSGLYPMLGVKLGLFNQEQI